MILAGAGVGWGSEESFPKKRMLEWGSAGWVGFK